MKVTAPPRSVSLPATLATLHCCTPALWTLLETARQHVETMVTGATHRQAPASTDAR